MLKYQPKIVNYEVEKNMNLAVSKMGKIQYFAGDTQIPMNLEHHQPCFIAKSADDLRADGYTRRALKQFQIVMEDPNIDDYNSITEQTAE